jgi:FtsP/CotA-like multicopper oxidase with cupredoxin domain
VHHFVEDQLLSGLSGMLVIDGVVSGYYPELARLRNRVMVLKGLFLPGQNQNTPQVKTINGLRNPPIKARPGEFQVWEIGNLGADAYFHLRLNEHPFWVLERDGNMLLEPQPVRSLFLPPGARTTVAVGAGRPGRYALRSLRVDTGPQGDPNPEVVVGTLVVGGRPVDDSAILRRLRRPAANPATITPKAEEIRALPITRRRTFVFSESANGNNFFINGLRYRENRVDTRVRLGDVEAWTIQNVSGELHVFNIHQLGFLVTEIRGGSLPLTPGLGVRDVVNLPYQVANRPGVVKMIVPFNDPIMVGKFVYHCHIVGHEDAGMMANIEVLPRRTAAGELWDRLTDLAGLDLPALWPTAAAGGGPPDLLAELQANICRSPTDEGIVFR